MSIEAATELEIRPRLYWTLVVGSCLLLLIAYWRVSHPMGGYRMGADSAVFISAGFHLLEGKVLYRDFWDHKPPMIHLLNGFSLLIWDDGINAMRTLIKYSLVLVGAQLLVIGTVVFRSFAVGLCTSLSFLWPVTIWLIFRDGNKTEFFGSIFLLGATTLMVLWAYLPKGRSLESYLMPAIGVLLGLTVLCKEPFVFIVPVVVLYILFQSMEDWRLVWRRLFVLALWFGVPCGIFLGYLLAFDAFFPWISTIEYNISYANHWSSGQVHRDRFYAYTVAGSKALRSLFLRYKAVTFLSVLALVSCVDTKYLNSRKHFSWFVFALLCASLAASSLGHQYPYYLLFSLPAMALICGVGVDYLRCLLVRYDLLNARVVSLTVVFLLLSSPELVSKPLKYIYSSRRSVSFNSRPYYRYILNNTDPNDYVWNLHFDDSIALYSFAKRQSPTPFFYHPVGYVWNMKNKKQVKEGVKQDLFANMPKIIRAKDDLEWIKRYGLGEWFRENYEKTGVPDVYRLKKAGHENKALESS